MSKLQPQRQNPHTDPRPLLDEPNQAINEFLETLLEPVQEYHPTQETLKQRQRVLEQKAPPVITQVEIPAPPEVEVVTQTAVATAVEAPLAPSALPSYSDQPFQCLLFRVSGNDFAIPLVTLHSIVKPSETAASLPGQPAWHRGILMHRDERVGLVDLSQLLGKGPGAGPTPFVIILGDGRFGLLAAEIFRPLRVEPAQIKWRSQRVERPWMLGTLREQLCPLIDADALLAMLR